MTLAMQPIVPGADPRIDMSVELLFEGIELKAYGPQFTLPAYGGPEVVVLEGDCSIPANTDWVMLTSNSEDHSQGDDDLYLWTVIGGNSDLITISTTEDAEAPGREIYVNEPGNYLFLYNKTYVVEVDDASVYYDEEEDLLYPDWRSWMVVSHLTDVWEPWFGGLDSYEPLTTIHHSWEEEMSSWPLLYTPGLTRDSNVTTDPWISGTEYWDSGGSDPSDPGYWFTSPANQTPYIRNVPFFSRSGTCLTIISLGQADGSTSPDPVCGDADLPLVLGNQIPTNIFETWESLHGRPQIPVHHQASSRFFQNNIISGTLGPGVPPGQDETNLYGFYSMFGADTTGDARSSLIEISSASPKTGSKHLAVLEHSTGSLDEYSTAMFSAVWRGIQPPDCFLTTQFGLDNMDLSCRVAPGLTLTTTFSYRYQVVSGSTSATGPSEATLLITYYNARGQQLGLFPSASGPAITQDWQTVSLTNVVPYPAYAASVSWTVICPSTSGSTRLRLDVDDIQITLSE